MIRVEVRVMVRIRVRERVGVRVGLEATVCRDGVYNLFVTRKEGSLDAFFR
jgi:hypothetical protein